MNIYVKLWELIEDYKKLEKENNKLKEEIKSLEIQLKYRQEDIEKRNQIIKILNEGYSPYHMTGKWVMSYSKEAEIMPYRDMEVLQITLENIINGVTGYED